MHFIEADTVDLIVPEFISKNNGNDELEDAR